MKPILSLIPAGLMMACVATPQPLRAQACQDEEGMVTEYKKGLVELADLARKESVPEFEKAYHQKAGVTRLTMTSSMVDGLFDCLDKAAQDPAAKDQADALKAKHDSYSKLKDQLTADRKSLKAADSAKSAKAVMEKFQYAN